MINLEIKLFFMRSLNNLLIGLLFVSMACTSAQVVSVLKSSGQIIPEEDGTLTTNEVVMGLKEALIQGVTIGTFEASRTDGYLGNLEIRIPFPPEIEFVEQKLRQVGLNQPVDDFIESINRAAEKAAAEAKPIFVDAIMTMTIDDAWNILKGEEDAATVYLKGRTSMALFDQFEPIIDEALSSVNATKYYSTMINAYNKIPFVEKADADLSAYVTGKAIDGLFVLVAQEEAKIRKDPAERTTEILKSVFGYNDQYLNNIII